MQSLLWFLTRQASKILTDPSERESFLGDLEERNLAGTFRGLADIACLIASRQLKLWQTWRPWLTLLALFFPLSVLMHSALSISLTLAKFPWPENPFYDSPDVKSLLAWGTASTILWAWSAGFALAKFGKSATWSLLPVLGLITHLPMQMSRAPYLWMLGLASWLMLVVFPAFIGARVCFQNPQLSGRAKCILVAITMLVLYFLVFDYANNRPNLRPLDAVMAALVLWPIAVPLTSRAR